MAGNKTKSTPSEVHAYVYISKELIEKKGWMKNQIYTQGECLEHSEIKKYLLQTKPENIVEINEKTFYVIEAKNERKKVDLALTEAREDYANKINLSNKIKVRFVTGIAGNNKEGYIAKSQFYNKGTWENVTENDIEITGLLSKKQVEDILQQQTAKLKDVEISEEEFLETAEDINEVLHENSIDKSYRARFISAILLAMSDGKEIDVTQDCDILIENINSRVKHILQKHGKLQFANFIKIDEPSSMDNHIKVKEAIKITYQELLNLNIRSAMNSGKDILGTFYEVFLKYGNGAKDIGIVLTPRHITKFVAQVLNITHNDLVLDPCCGTGGFLVSAFDEVRKKTNDKDDFEKFRLYGIYGIEEQDAIISLAIVNMIFRGDGKNNMIEGNCFRKWLNAKTENKTYFAEYLPDDKIDPEDDSYFYPKNKMEKKDRTSPITKVMMNPPFALKKGAEKEYKFIEHALKQMEDGGILFSILPISVLVEKEIKEWRKDILLKNNSLLSVITFPDELFQPSASVGTVGIFIKKGIPHNYNKQKVYFARAIEDGFKMRKGKRVKNPKSKDLLSEINEELKAFLANKNILIKDIPEFKRICLLDKEDADCELTPEAYIESRIPSLDEINDGIEVMIREAIAFDIRFHDKIKGAKNE